LVQFINPIQAIDHFIRHRPKPHRQDFYNSFSRLRYFAAFNRKPFNGR
jgi:hypothetical protein